MFSQKPWLPHMVSLAHSSMSEMGSETGGHQSSRQRGRKAPEDHQRGGGLRHREHAVQADRS